MTKDHKSGASTIIVTIAHLRAIYDMIRIVDGHGRYRVRYRLFNSFPSTVRQYTFWQINRSCHIPTKRLPKITNRKALNCGLCFYGDSGHGYRFCIGFCGNAACVRVIERTSLQKICRLVLNYIRKFRIQKIKIAINTIRCYKRMTYAQARGIVSFLTPTNINKLINGKKIM